LLQKVMSRLPQERSPCLLRVLPDKERIG